MQAKITHSDGWCYMVEGQVYKVPCGQTVIGALAKKAIESGRAEEVKPKPKRKSFRGAPENKGS